MPLESILNHLFELIARQQMLVLFHEVCRRDKAENLVYSVLQSFVSSIDCSVKAHVSNCACREQFVTIYVKMGQSIRGNGSEFLFPS